MRGLLFLVLALLISQPVAASSYPITISYGRSWPLSIVADSSRGMIYFDATSGEYPPTGFSYGAINVTTHEVVMETGLNVIPGPMALDQATGDVYVAGNDQVEVFAGGTQDRGTFSVGHPIFDIAYDGSVSRNLFVTTGTQVLAVDPQTGTIVAEAALEGSHDMVLDPANGRLYVSQFPNVAHGSAAPGIAVLEASTLSLVGTIGIATCCATHLALDPASQLLYASTGINYVYIIDLNGANPNNQVGSLVRSIQVSPTANSTNSIVVDPAMGRVYVSISPGRTILELDVGTDGNIGTFSVPAEVAGLALDAKTNELYATNYHQVTVFDTHQEGVLNPAIVAVLASVGAAAIAITAYRLATRRGKTRPAVSSSGREP